MSIKLVAIGNRLMGDDGIAIYIAEKLEAFAGNKEIEMIIGETDFLYCLSKIEEGDELVILDAICNGTEPGTVTQHLLMEIHKIAYHKSLFSQHGYTLFTALKNYAISAHSIVIGIEGRNFNYSLELSNELKAQTDNICIKVKEIIDNYESSNNIEVCNQLYEDKEVL
jgi:hydrogenase maturation protease